MRGGEQLSRRRESCGKEYNVCVLFDLEAKRDGGGGGVDTKTIV